MEERKLDLFWQSVYSYSFKAKHLYNRPHPYFGSSVGLSLLFLRALDTYILLRIYRSICTRGLSFIISLFWLLWLIATQGRSLLVRVEQRWPGPAPREHAPLQPPLQAALKDTLLQPAGQTVLNARGRGEKDGWREDMVVTGIRKLYTGYSQLSFLVSFWFWSFFNMNNHNNIYKKW